MHNAALAEMARADSRFSDWTYYKFDINPDRLEEALQRFYDKGFAGLNLTVPHKILATQWVGVGEAEVEWTGACNTLMRTENGFIGYNTDLYGMTSAIESEFDIRIKDHEVLLIGAGGAARAAAVACVQAGVKTLTLVNRTVSKLDAMAESLKKLNPGTSIQTAGLKDPMAGNLSHPLVINATSLGLHPQDPAPVDVRKLPKNSLVFDMIYNPERTALLLQAASLGMRVANGLSMLAFQGERSLKIWSNHQPSADTMFKAALAGLRTH